jgi:hypothetical protein
MVTADFGADGATRNDASGSVPVKLSDVTPQQILEHRENVLSSDPAKQLHSTQHFRRLLSIGTNKNLFCTCLLLSFYIFVPK